MDTGALIAAVVVVGLSWVVIGGLGYALGRARARLEAPPDGASTSEKDRPGPASIERNVQNATGDLSDAKPESFEGMAEELREERGAADDGDDGGG